MTAGVRSGRSRRRVPGHEPDQASVVLVCGPTDSVIVRGVAAGLARERGEAVGDSVRIVALDSSQEVGSEAGLDSADAVVLIARDPAEDLTSARDREHVVTESAGRLFSALAGTDVRRLVVVTSAVVYGPHPHNPVPMPEDHVAEEPPAPGVIAALQAVEDAARALAGRSVALRLVILRPAALVAEGIDGDVTRHFAAPRLLGLRGVSMAWQFCHVDDLAGAVMFAIEGRLDPAEGSEPGAEVSSVVAAVGSPGCLLDADVEAVCHKRRIDLPPTLVFGAADRLQRLGATVSGSVPALVYPWVVEPTRLLAAGWQPTYDNTAALEALLGEARAVLHQVARRHGREAAGAAGATVAALGTALVVRRARRRRQSG
jgi:hypothetical protein